MLRTWSKRRFDFIEVMTASPWTDHCTIIKEVPWRWWYPKEWKTRSPMWRERRFLQNKVSESLIDGICLWYFFFSLRSHSIGAHFCPLAIKMSRIMWTLSSTIPHPLFVHCVSSTPLHSSSFTVFLPANSWGLLKVPPPGVPVPSPMPPSSSSGVAKPESRLDGLGRWKTRTKMK